MTDYEKLYQQDADVCGDPFPEFRRFFDEHTGQPLSVLDLGCGQGRDTLMIARMGHRVVAVDIAPTGISQILAVARRERLNVQGVEADIRKYRPTERFDVVVLDRTLHMLASSEERCGVLTTATIHTFPHGHVLIADTPSNGEEIVSFLRKSASWQIVLKKKGFTFARRNSASPARQAHAELQDEPVGHRPF